jgi:hypothetical protein
MKKRKPRILYLILEPKESIKSSEFWSYTSYKDAKHDAKIFKQEAVKFIESV